MHGNRRMEVERRVQQLYRQVWREQTGGFPSLPVHPIRCLVGQLEGSGMRSYEPISLSGLRAVVRDRVGTIVEKSNPDGSE